MIPPTPDPQNSWVFLRVKAWKKKSLVLSSGRAESFGRQGVFGQAAVTILIARARVQS